jgi:hypothetical protein
MHLFTNMLISYYKIFSVVSASNRKMKDMALSPYHKKLKLAHTKCIRSLGRREFLLSKENFDDRGKNIKSACKIHVQGHSY